MDSCPCGKPIVIKKTGECKTCYNHRYATGHRHDPKPHHPCSCGRELVKAGRKYCSECKPVPFHATIAASEYRKSRYAAEKGKRYLRHHLTAEQFASLAAGGCSICSSRDGLCVDHDHACCPGAYSCGECVRGVLCRPCNAAIGLLGDDVERIRRAAEYLTTVSTS